MVWSVDIDILIWTTAKIVEDRYLNRLRKRAIWFAKSTALWKTGGGHCIGETLQTIIDSLKQTLSKTVESSKILSWLKHFRKRNQNSKKNDRVLCTTILGFHVCKISVESIKNRVTLNEISEIIQSHELSYDHALTVEEIFEVADEPLVYSHLLRILEGQEKLQANYSPLGQKYLKAVLNGKKVVNIDYVWSLFQRRGNDTQWQTYQFA